MKKLGDLDFDLPRQDVEPLLAAEADAERDEEEVGAVKEDDRRRVNGVERPVDVNDGRWRRRRVGHGGRKLRRVTCRLSELRRVAKEIACYSKSGEEELVESDACDLGERVVHRRRERALRLAIRASSNRRVPCAHVYDPEEDFVSAAHELQACFALADSGSHHIFAHSVGHTLPVGAEWYGRLVQFLATIA